MTFTYIADAPVVVREQRAKLHQHFPRLRNMTYQRVTRSTDEKLHALELARRMLKTAHAGPLLIRVLEEIAEDLDT